ncbi:MAG: RAD55 family ATPase [Nitrososphaerales archaeon]
MNNITQALSDLTFKESLPGGLTVLSGTSGCGKTIFSEQYAHEFLFAGGKVLWITTEELPTSLKSGMARFGWNIEKYETESRFAILDAVTPARLGFSQSLGNGTLSLDPTGMLIVISDQMRANESSKVKLLVVIDSISRLLLSCDPRSVIDFVSCISSRMENYGVSGLATISEGAHDERTLNALTFSCAGTIRFRIREENEKRRRQFRIETLRGRRHIDAWKDYSITDAGFNINS